MNQLQLYKYATGAMVLLNIALVLFFFLTKPDPPRGDGARNFRPKAIEILQLDTNQRATFVQLAERHNQQMEALSEQQRARLKPYFGSLVDAVSDTTALIQEVAQLERDKVEVTYQHFQEVRSILTEEQLPYFEQFVSQALDILLLNREKPRPPEASEQTTSIEKF